MIWLQRPPWIRWILSALIASGALWVEFGSGATTDHPFAIAEINTGDAITDLNTELRAIPSGILDDVAPIGFATRPFSVGEPLTPDGINETTPLPSSVDGWWALAVDVPAGARIGDGVQLVLLDSGLVVPGIVDAVAGDDPLGDGSGAVAIPSDYAVEVAAGVANGRVVILVAAG